LCLTIGYNREVVMQVAELRKRLITRIERVAAHGDEEETALVMAFARAILVALAPNSADEEVSLQELSVGTQTAALIMGYHREYVRALVRGGELSATKSNGELQIPLAEIAEHVSKELRFVHPVHPSLARWREMEVLVQLQQ
jgi:hypothetical protein